MSWDITITDANATTHSPSLYEPQGETYPKRIPAEGGAPTLKAAVLPQRDSNGVPKWFGSEFEDADVSVSFNGTTQPYDTLVEVTDDADSDLVILSFEGGDELQTRVETSVDVQQTHLFAQDLITNNTSYQADAPAPAATRTDGVTVEDRVAGAISAGDIAVQPDDSPAYVDANGHLTLYQTLFQNKPNTTIEDQGDTISFDISLGYSIPPDAVGIGILAIVDDNSVGLQLKVDGNVVGELQPGALTSGSGINPAWTLFQGAETRLEPGTHTVRIQVTQDSPEGGSGATSYTGLNPDQVIIYDDRFNYSFPTDGSGPENYPRDGFPVRLSPPLVTRAVRGVDFSGTWTNQTTGTVVVGNGVDETTGTSADFASYGPEVVCEVVLEPYGSDGSSVTTLEGYTLTADLEDMPLIVGESFDGTVASILTDAADTLRGDFVWAYDTDSNGNPTVRFVRTGSRTSSQSEIETYKITKCTADTLDEVRVRGGRPAVDNERIRVQHGTAVDLERDRVIEDSETVTEPNRNQPYERGVHYTVDYAAGTITAIANPTRADPISDDSVVSVSYQFQALGEDSLSSPASPVRETVVDIPALRSDRACRLAAKQILDAASTPSYRAVAEIRGNTTYSVVADLASSKLPVSSLQTTDITATATGARVQLEAIQDEGAFIADLEDRIQSVARHTR